MATPSADSGTVALRASIEQMLDDYRILPTSQAGNQPIRPEIAESFRAVKERDPSTWTWTDAYSLQRAWVEILPLERLRFRVTKVRDEYRAVSTGAAYAKYEATNPPDPRTASECDLRADLAELYVEIHRFCALRPQVEAERNGLSRRTMYLTLSLVSVGLVLVAVSMSRHTFDRKNPYTYSGTPLLVLIALTGALGGFMSVQQRIHAMPIEDNSTINMLSLARSWSSVYFSPPSGAVFAVALYLVFAGGLLKGTLFPEVFVPPSQPGHQGMDFAYFSEFAGPASGKDHAMLIIWSFIAGFAERFVPDRLTQLTRAAAVAKQAEPT